jgi:glycosyltransferase involved in cell wall biosynthesis
VTAVHFVVPDAIDDPARPSGGNVYDRNLSGGLTSLGWTVHEHAVAGFWQHADATSFAALDGAVQRIPDDAVVLLDGLVASPAPEVLVPQASRLRLVVLVHMPLGDGPGRNGPDDASIRERTVLLSAAAIVTTSSWTRRRLLELYPLPPHRVHVAEPAVEAAALATGSATGGELLCVAPLTPGKGHDVLLDALATVTDLPWRCTCVGSLDRDPACADAIRRRAREAGLGERVRFTGTRTGADLERSYAAADLLVLASRAEAYGMVVTEALARGVPVVAADVGGVTEALGHSADGVRPGLLVPPADPAALAGALRRWFGDAALRGRLRRAAYARRESLPRWATTAATVANVLAAASR